MTAKAKSTSTKTDDQGKVYYIKTSKGLYPLSVLQKAEKKPKSTQLRLKTWIRDQGLKPHPFNTDSLLELQESSSYFDACVRQIAQDVVGQGWEVKAREGVEKPNEEERKKIIDFLNDSNDEDEDIVEIIRKAIIDWGTIGWWCLEIERDPPEDGEPIGLWHIPAHTIWCHKDHARFVQIRQGSRVWFRRFNSGLRISSKTGNEVKGQENLAHEIIFQKEYYQRSDYYGRPNIYPAVSAVIGLIGAKQYNLAFFENYGIPSAIIILEGRWSAEAARQITNFLDLEIKGSSNAHKTLVLKPPANGKVTYIPLATEVKEASFRLYQKDLRDEILASYKMPPYRIGIAETGSLGGSTAAEATKIYASSIIQPLKNRTARVVNKIIQDGQKDFYFEWGKLDTRDMDALVKRFQLLFMMGSMTPNQIRRELGWEPRKDPDGDQYYVAANFVPVGEEGVEKRELTTITTLQDLAAKINESLKSSQEQREIFNRLVLDREEE